jgi:hypothetical protein
MKITITERQLNYFVDNLYEQGIITPSGDIIGPGGVTRAQGIDPHIILPILEIASLFIPVVGPFIAIGIGMADAALYYNEGDKKTAVLVAVLSILPGAGVALKKAVPGIMILKKAGMAALGKKLGQSAKPALTKTEIEVVKGLSKNKELVKKSISDHFRGLGKKLIPSKHAKNLTALEQSNIVNFVKTGAIKTGKVAVTGGKAVAPYIAAGYTTLKAYDAAASAGKLGPIEYIKTIGYTKKHWVVMQTIFGTDKTGKGNMKIVAALKDGWRLGDIIPEKHQTEYYKKILAKEKEDQEKLKLLIASTLEKLKKDNS